MKHEPKHTLIEELRNAGEDLDSLLNTFLHKVNKESGEAIKSLERRHEHSPSTKKKKKYKT